tara:strand:- start:1622 stop:3013 length:1392 start_codon:yes stop_codon:yes gene_type:complete
MSISNSSLDALKEIPSVDELIIHNQNKVVNLPYNLCIQVIRKRLNEIRIQIKKNVIKGNIKKYVYNEIHDVLQDLTRPNIKNIINGTGIILHTGLGRAPISKKLIKRAIDKINPYTNIELDISTGKRGERNHHVIDLLNCLTGSESALVVNNNAAAVLLILNTFSEGKEVIISRGEQIEIGGSFRIPDVIEKAGCKMVEVGTTNKTHLNDYNSAISNKTGAILVAHTSNYKVMGFTESVKLSVIGELANKKKIPLLVDLGCGALADFKKIGLPDEPSVLSYMSSTSGVFCFSGDKLLGGPQSGIICGKKTFIKKIHKNPLYRALRCDKITYSILEETLRTFIEPTVVHPDNLFMTLFQRPTGSLKKLANFILNNISKEIIKKYNIEIQKTYVETGSGSLPLEKLPSIALVFKDRKASHISKLLRMANPPIVGYISNNNYYLDLKAIPTNQKLVLIDVINRALL